MSSSKSDTLDHSGHKHKSLAPLFCVSLALWFGVLAIGIVIGLGCISNDGLYIVRLSSNHSSPIEVSLGYAGTCVKTTQASVCISHVAYEGDDDESIAEQFQRELDGHQTKNNTGTGTETGTGTNPLINGTSRISFRDVSTSPNSNDTSLDMSDLKTLLGITSSLQNNVFPLDAPLSFVVLFALSTVILWCLLPSPTGTRTSKAVLAGAILLNSYGLTLGFMVALATRQACAGLVVPRTGAGAVAVAGLLDAAADVYVVEGDALQTLQWVVVAVAAVLQGCVAWLFVQRRAAAVHDVQVSVLPTVVNNISLMKTRRCCCCF
ncbi:hypothetical protein F4782DRAFT_550768 [Xylaria castorea]|nr:hypothetical protein F4782DRAFT_550768 [Xylaria castorea]